MFEQMCTPFCKEELFNFFPEKTFELFSNHMTWLRNLILYNCTDPKVNRQTQGAIQQENSYST